MTKAQARLLINKLEGVRILLGNAQNEKNIPERDLMNFKARLEIMEVIDVINDTYLKPKH